MEVSLAETLNPTFPLVDGWRQCSGAAGTRVNRTETEERLGPLKKRFTSIYHLPMRRKDVLERETAKSKTCYNEGHEETEGREKVDIHRGRLHPSTSRFLQKLSE